MTASAIQDNLYEFIRPKYPNILIKVEDTVDQGLQLYFIEERFAPLYPTQRYHVLMHLIPPDFYEKNLKKAEWFELAPNENPDDLFYYDQELIDDIKEPILSILEDKIDFATSLDNKFTDQQVKCFGDFRHSKNILANLNFSDEDQFDIFHVLMNEGGYCDCEILYNVFTESKYSKKYWGKRDY